MDRFDYVPFNATPDAFASELSNYERMLTEEMIKGMGLPSELLSNGDQWGASSLRLVWPTLDAISAFEGTIREAIERKIQRHFASMWRASAEAAFRTVAYGTESLEVVVSELRDREWSTFLTRSLRGQPGVRFADLMMGVGRN